jgi:hypothetical protein
VATGSAYGSRRPLWVAALAQSDLVLVAFDADEAGDKESTYWLRALPHAVRWRPTRKDVNEMLEQGEPVRGWVLCSAS